MAKAAFTLIAACLLALAGAGTGCQSHLSDPLGGFAGPGTGEPGFGPRVGKDGAVALGPFPNDVDYGWLPCHPGTLWGWGWLRGYDEWLYFTLDPRDALSLRTMRVASDVASPGDILPLDDGVVATRGPEDSRVWRLGFDGPPVDLGPGGHMKEAPSGRFALWFAPSLGGCLYDRGTGTTVPVKTLPCWDFPCTGCATTWIDDSLVVVRTVEHITRRSSLRIVSLPDGTVLGTAAPPEWSLSPYPAPGGQWLAALGIDPATAVWADEGCFEFDGGQALTMYPRADFSTGGFSHGVQVPVPGGGLVTSLVWAPDGATIAFAGVASVSIDMDYVTEYQAPFATYLARPPSFEPEEIPLSGHGLDPDLGPWLPLSFSPDGRFLALSGVGADEPPLRVTAIWDIAAGCARPQSPSRAGASLDLEQFSWVGPHLALACETDSTGQYGALVDVSTGEATRVPWLAVDRRPVLGAASMGFWASRVTVGASGRLPSFGRVPEGTYLVVAPLGYDGR